MKPEVCILRTDGTNCDQELFYAFEKYGGNPVFVHINELRNKSKKLKDFQILALPGGFTYGDDVASGKILAVELVSFLKDQLKDYIKKRGLILGICNGFQTLIRTGLLPFRRIGQMDATLAQNESGHFECRWVNLKVQKSRCQFLNEFDGNIRQFAVNHGEGKLIAEKKAMEKIENENLVVFRYVDRNGKVTQKYPNNPNGSTNAIAGMSDPSGRILGLMPHPEKFVEVTQHPNWRRWKSADWWIKEPHGSFIFESIIKFAKQQ